MEPESSLPYSQVPATCPYPKPTNYYLFLTPIGLAPAGSST
jgi:hypothetical protein